VAPTQPFGATDLDVLINEAWEKMDPGRAEYLAKMIDQIEQVCRGRERTEQGFWRVAPVT